MLPRRRAQRHRLRAVRDVERSTSVTRAVPSERVHVTEALVLDLPGQRLLGPQGEILLSARAFQLLAYLVQHPDRVSCRQELLDAVWGRDYMGTDRVVDQTICWLRRQLEPDPAHPRYLLTRHGVGYELRPPPQEAGICHPSFIGPGVAP